MQPTAERELVNTQRAQRKENRMGDAYSGPKRRRVVEVNVLSGLTVML